MDYCTILHFSRLYVRSLPCHPENKLSPPENAPIQLHFCRLAGFFVWISVYMNISILFIYSCLHRNFTEENENLPGGKNVIA